MGSYGGKDRAYQASTGYQDSTKSRGAGQSSSETNIVAGNSYRNPYGMGYGQQI